MEGYKFINSLKIQNLLSYGSSGETIDLQPLNVIRGTNGVGKSNLIEVLGLLQGIPTDLTKPIREGGGVNEWLWKGTQETPIAKIEAIINYPEGRMPLRYRIDFTTVAQRLEIIDEAIENEQKNNDYEQDVFFFYRYQQGHPVLNARRITENEPTRTGRQLRREDLKPDQSVLSQRKDPDLYPELSYLSNQFSQIRLYREWNLGRYTPPRMPQKLDLPEDFLLEDCSNLGLILNDLQHRIGSRKIVENLQKFYEPVTDITIKIAGGTVQIFLHERGLNQPIPATRLSDGTLRYLCLLMILLHPTPPPLICIEEPELGLHPDILPTIAELLIDASQKTQLIVTTHSDDLISALSEIPESILVCERDERGSRMRRLEPEALKDWLENYSLGDLRSMGELGGNRW
ncbi:MAG TPA: chromosome segregation protein SMC [Oscillatoriales bacterium UBA8482]|nr:MAG: chromosome segregation protein SMC [Oscillatoriales cyanobacterium CG2_30_40_61]HBW56814.1 chromosome segregation protein SMC [Oscillatoriales bacterium UBA8482]